MGSGNSDWKETVVPFFDRHVRHHGTHINSLGWFSKESQYTRFDVIATYLPKSPFSVLDVGCGFGDFFHYCQINEIPADYTGVDISTEMIHRAKLAYPSARFFNLDILSPGANLESTYDVVVANGAFNLKVPDQMAYLLTMCKAMFALTTSTLVVTLLTGAPTSPAFYYYQPEDVLVTLRHLGQVEIQDGYLPNDFTIVLQKR